MLGISFHGTVSCADSNMGRKANSWCFIGILEAPTLFVPDDASSSNGLYMVILIDQDVLPEGQDKKVEFLHWFQPNLMSTDDDVAGVLAVQNSSDATNATLSTAPSAIYLTPTPPEGSGPHRYTFLLYAQPDDFVIPAAYANFFSDVPDLSNRLPFDIKQFAEDSKLGEPLAANWLRVLNGSSEETSVALTSTVAPSSTASGSANTATTTPSSASSGSQTGTATGSSSSSSATGSGSGAGLLDARDNLKELVFGLAVGLGGMGLWL